MPISVHVNTTGHAEIPSGAASLFSFTRCFWLRIKNTFCNLMSSSEQKEFNNLSLHIYTH